jgi:hypothetical protein
MRADMDAMATEPLVPALAWDWLVGAGAPRAMPTTLAMTRAIRAMPTILATAIPGTPLPGVRVTARVGAGLGKCAGQAIGRSFTRGAITARYTTFTSGQPGGRACVVGEGEAGDDWVATVVDPRRCRKRVENRGRRLVTGLSFIRLRRLCCRREGD